MGWNDRLRVGPGYTVDDIDRKAIAQLPPETLQWLLGELAEDHPDQAEVVREIMRSMGSEAPSE